jgi:ubiquitin C-terminal hydrolase
LQKKNNLFLNINIGTEMGQYLMFMNQFYSQNTSIISKNFYGINESIVHCLNCGYNTFNFSIFNFIIFPLEEARKYSIQQGQILILNQRIKTFIQLLNNTKEGKITLKNCFEYNQKLDFLQGENSIFCNHCHKSSNAQMCNKIIFTPKILCIVLNRGRGNIYQVKIDFPEILDLSIFVQNFAQNKRYELIGVITHLGQSGPGGHFIAICKSIVNGQWYTFNDQIVSPSSFNDALNTGVPYILFYHAIQ